ncbi:hypothetical protein D3C74_50060 [compost metagenome]
MESESRDDMMKSLMNSMAQDVANVFGQEVKVLSRLPLEQGRTPKGMDSLKEPVFNPSGFIGEHYSLFEDSEFTVHPARDQRLRSDCRPKGKYVGAAARCFNCFKKWDITGAVKKGVLHSLECPDCGGFVIMPDQRSRIQMFTPEEENKLKQYPSITKLEEDADELQG